MHEHGRTRRGLLAGEASAVPFEDWFLPRQAPAGRSRSVHPRPEYDRPAQASFPNTGAGEQCTSCQVRRCVEMSTVSDQFRSRAAGTPLRLPDRRRGHPIPSQIDRGPCAQGRWQQALYAANAPRRIGTMYGCGLTIQKGTAPGRDPAWISQTARERFVLPGGAITATCTERFVFNADQHRSRATFRCRINDGGTINGSGSAVNGHANYVLKIN